MKSEYSFKDNFLGNKNSYSKKYNNDYKIKTSLNE
jgi:hypothetical protein